MRLDLTRTLAAALVLGALAPTLASAQQPARRRQEPITIRGQVPTPQVVTVRPREVPTYQRNVLVPNFYDRDFWVAILPAYMMVPERMVTGESPLPAGADSLAGDPTMMPADSTGAAMPGAPSGARMGAPMGRDSTATNLPPLPPRPSRPFARPAPGTASASPTR